MTTILSSLFHGGVQVCLDNILIASSSPEENYLLTRKTLTILQKNSLCFKMEKFVFNAETVEYLGFIVNKDGLKVQNHNYLNLKNFKRPETLRDLRSFKGTTNYLRRFIKGLSFNLTPLYNLLKGNQKSFEWADDCDTAFETIKRKLSSNTLLNFPKINVKYLVETDASNTAIGSALF
jgi:RNase H-like domain found in reverse transcriptase